MSEANTVPALKADPFNPEEHHVGASLGFHVADLRGEIGLDVVLAQFVGR
jgi:hypothetical protein